MQFVDVLSHMTSCFCWNPGHLPYGQQECCRFVNALLQTHVLISMIVEQNFQDISTLWKFRSLKCFFVAPTNQMELAERVAYAAIIIDLKRT